MCSRSVLLAAMLAMAPFGAKGADLVVWWEKGVQAQEDEAVIQIIAAFEQDSGKHTELSFYPRDELPKKGSRRRSRPVGLPTLLSAIGWSPIFRSGLSRIGWWISRTPSATSRTCSIQINSTGPCCSTPGSGSAPCAIPKEWEPFWAFWCDQAQPAVRKALGRDDIWGIGRAMSLDAADTTDQFFQFVRAYQGDYVTGDGKLAIDDPEIRRRLVKAIDSYTAVYRKDCTPPASLTWDDGGNNEAFLAGTVLMTPNYSLSIPMR
jgi:multiple sugar transport system substrate-binding protein